jgi:hypothetical protein
MVLDASSTPPTRSGHRGDNFSLGREPAKHLLGAYNAVVDPDLKDATAGAPQSHLCIWSDLVDDGSRLTGARFIVSLPAVMDFDAHWLRSLFMEAVVVSHNLMAVGALSSGTGSLLCFADLQRGHTASRPRDGLVEVCEWANKIGGCLQQRAWIAWLHGSYSRRPVVSPRPLEHRAEGRALGAGGAAALVDQAIGGGSTR